MLLSRHDFERQIRICYTSHCKQQIFLPLRDWLFTTTIFIPYNKFQALVMISISIYLGYDMNYCFAMTTLSLSLYCLVSQGKANQLTCSNRINAWILSTVSESRVLFACKRMLQSSSNYQTWNLSLFLTTLVVMILLTTQPATKKHEIVNVSNTLLVDDRVIMKVAGSTISSTPESSLRE